MGWPPREARCQGPFGRRPIATLAARRLRALWMHTCVGGGAAVAASLAVSPFILIIDRAVIEAAAGQGTLFRRIGVGCER